MTVKRITPVLFVQAIEPVLPFWVDALGFEKTIEVPGGDAVDRRTAAADGAAAAAAGLHRRPPDATLKTGGTTASAGSDGSGPRP